MLEALVVTLREGIEAALVIGIILTYLQRTGKSRLNKQVYIGLAVAVAASILVTVLFQQIGFDPENETLEGTMMLVAAMFVGSMVVWMWKTAKNIKQEMESRLEAITQEKVTGRQVWGIFAFTFFMVFREGVETVLFLAALTYSSSPAANFAGGFVGLALAVLFAVFFVRGSIRINLQRFFSVTGIILLLLVVRLVFGSLHEFGEVGIIPLTPAAMKIIGFVVRDSVSAMITMMLLTLPIVMVLLDVQDKKDHVLAGAQSSVDRRKALAAARRERNWKYSVVAAALVINLVLVSDVIAQVTRAVNDPAPVAVTAVDGKVAIPLADLPGDSAMRRYQYDAGGIPVKFLLVKRPDGSLGSGFDACEICGPKGYYQEMEGERNLVCINCNAPIALPTIGFPGGCNPVALKAQVADNQVVIQVAELDQGREIFGK